MSLIKVLKDKTPEGSKEDVFNKGDKRQKIPRKAEKCSIGNKTLCNNTGNVCPFTRPF